MDKPLLILHGWSDTSGSFKPLAELFAQQLNKNPTLIDLGDYISMDDDVTYADLAVALQHAWQVTKLPIAPFSVDVVVHSTAGLIIREWMIRYFTPETVPVKHLLMLAPANFGSPLAHKGRAFFGRVIKGFNNQKLFQVGANLLRGLELASPYTWELALQDRFGLQDFYGPNKVLCTVLIGNTGYGGISAAANEDGSDGTVRIASSNLNCAYLTADFSRVPLQPTYTLRSSIGSTAFVIMDGENHSTIIAKDDGPRNPHTLPTMMRALTLTDNEFTAWCLQLEQTTYQLMQRGVEHSATHGFQNMVCFAHDQFGFHIKDYFIEFYGEEKESHWLEEFFHRDLITTTHAYQDDTSYRSLYIDCTLLEKQRKTAWPDLKVSLTALPDLEENKNVGYRTFTDNDIGGINISPAQIPLIFKQNRTLCIEIILRREQSSQLFQLHEL